MIYRQHSSAFQLGKVFESQISRVYRELRRLCMYFVIGHNLQGIRVKRVSAVSDLASFLTLRILVALFYYPIFRVQLRFENGF